MTVSSSIRGGGWLLVVLGLSACAATRDVSLDPEERFAPVDRQTYLTLQPLELWREADDPRSPLFLSTRSTLGRPVGPLPAGTHIAVMELLRIRSGDWLMLMDFHDDDERGVLVRIEDGRFAGQQAQVYGPDIFWDPRYQEEGVPAHMIWMPNPAILTPAPAHPGPAKGTGGT